ncbi:MAG TPA: PQQ-dependent sugar dehydrogenase [Gaiellaceae bacterium]|nr:PQQ-dependent sugar dehydrogenase [Gaiellaceae bacterium]
MRLVYPLGVSILLLLSGSAAARPLLRPAPELTVPAGWVAERYASGLTRPTAMAFGPDGRLYVAQESGQIVVVGLGSTKARVVARGFSEPLGLAWKGKRLFVSSMGRLDSLDLVGKRLVGRRTLLRRLPNGRHQQDNVVVGRDGRLYIGNGSTCDVCAEKDPRSATILSVRPDGRDLKIVATGLRNPYGLAVQPRTGRLYATVNGRDDLGDEPAEMLVLVKQGRDFGWPGCWPSFAEKRLKGSCAGVTPPVAYLEPRSGAGGIAFSRDGRTAYIALWGQYLATTHGRTVVRVELAPDGSVTGQRVFASGFGHPLAVLVTRAGALLVSDWDRGRLYRIRPR